MNATKVVFLDVDGVLNDMETDYMAPHGCIGLDVDMVEHLKKIIDATDAKIVLTSTWKAEWDKEPENRSEDGQYLNDVLEAQNLCIADKTTDRVADRGHGIRRYLAAHPEIKAWIVLDDDIFADYEECNIQPHLIHTSFYIGGLTEELADKAIEKLNAQEEANDQLLAND